MRLQSAIFDLDGTLLDTASFWEQLYLDLLKQYGADPEPGVGALVSAMSPKEGAAYCKEHYHLTASLEEILGAVSTAAADFYCHRVQAKPGLDKALSLLKMEGVWMYVATSTDRRLAEAALRCAGIDGYFRGLITCADVGASKEDSPAVYESAMRRLQSNKRDTVIFEDSLAAIRTAKAAGFRVAGVYNPAAEADQAAIQAEADYYLRSFEEMFDATDLG